MVYVDLHVHSTFSDGTLTPVQIVRIARKKGISILSLTDHDTVDGLPEFLSSCRHEGLIPLSGVELSANFPGTMHILGYRIDHRDPTLAESLENLRKHRNERNLKIFEKLVDSGMDLDFQEILDEAGGNVVARPHFARVLVKKKYAKTISHAFNTYLAHGCPAYVPRVRLDPRECIELIHHAGGVAVLAHPWQTTTDPQELETILEELRSYGLWGMECVYSGYSADQVMSLLKMALRLKLFSTAGTDFHGDNRQKIDLGMRVSEGLIPWARLGIRL